MNVPLGSIVGYKVRFDNKGSAQTRLGFLADSLLLQQYAGDSTLKNYDCIVIDEAYGRTTNTDMLLDLLKKLIQQRKHLKVVIMSATINHEKFCQYFGTTNVFETKCCPRQASEDTTNLAMTQPS
ncbi:hypothetical protein DER46DRAFT_394041 [Fusarium sp. MPI-SDFR-AT-0072]|nr:hypothetical protein DER46DRAFT_394041 [Fusarium sp. MPI-SDFR-AT-0072]